MRKLKPNKEKIVNEILVKIEAGKLYSEVQTINRSVWKLSSSTFTRYWKLAQDQYRERLDAIKQEQADQFNEAQKTQSSEAVASKQERLEAVTRILRGQSRKAGNRTVYPTEDQIVKAAEYLSKIDGDFAPEKREITEKKAPVFSFREVIHKLSTETLNDLIANTREFDDTRTAVLRDQLENRAV